MSVDIGIGLAVLVSAFVLLVRVTFYKSRYSRIDDAVLFTRQLSIEDFEQVTDVWIQSRQIAFASTSIRLRRVMAVCGVKPFCAVTRPKYVGRYRFSAFTTTNLFLINLTCTH